MDSVLTAGFKCGRITKDLSQKIHRPREAADEQSRRDGYQPLCGVKGIREESP
jgi:hypothetical protein